MNPSPISTGSGALVAVLPPGPPPSPQSEPISNDMQNPNSPTTIPTPVHRSSRPSRRPKFSPSDDLVLIREVAAAKADIAPNGETKERFEIAAARANATGKRSSAVTWKSIQDSYKKLQTRVDNHDREEARMSGVGGELGEMEELLSSMKKARDDKEREALEKRKVVKDKEAEKEKLGAVIREQALKRHAERTANKARSSSKDIDEDSDTPRKKRRLGDALKEGFDNELRVFTETLARCDEERNRINEDRLKLERDRFEAEKAEREKDRQERKEDRTAAQELELQDFSFDVGAVGKERILRSSRLKNTSPQRSGASRLSRLMHYPLIYS